jgi:predicted dinucleotide-binding enzyme
MENSIKSIGIIGAGKVSIVLAQLAVKAGYQVYVAGSGDPQKITLSISVLVPGAIALTSKEVAQRADAIILAIPLGRYKELPVKELNGKLVIDAMNYWWEIDGQRPEFTDPKVSTSELVQKFLSESRVVKAFSHIGYHDLYDGTRPEGAFDRKAVAIAGDDASDVNIVSKLVNDLGFDPVPIGPLRQGIKLQPGGPIFGAHVSVNDLSAML